MKRIQSVPLVIGQFIEMIDEHTGIVGSTTGSNYYVRVLSTLDRELLKPNTSVALHRHSHSLVDILPPESDSTIQLLGVRHFVGFIVDTRSKVKSQTSLIQMLVVLTCKSKRLEKL